MFLISMTKGEYYQVEERTGEERTGEEGKREGEREREREGERERALCLL